MTRVGAADGSSRSPAEQEILLLETLKSLLESAMFSLSGGEAAALHQVSRQIISTANQVTALSVPMGRFPLTPEALRQRRKVLAELGQQRAFCRTLLRRWRRSLALRRHFLGLRVETEPLPYTESLEED